MRPKSLAIVIPAYKPQYLDSTLHSLSNQSCKDFIVYIGDDCSPSDLFSIVNKYSGKLVIKYTRFKDNFGKKSLIDQWTRCVNLSEGEEWIWLFSDDDIAEPECVQSFYESEVHDSINVLHFNIDIIDSGGKIIRMCPEYPALLTSDQFFRRLYTREIVARMPEFIFRASELKRNGFVDFDLAWRSDNATVMNYAYPCGIMQIPGNCNKVLWRDSVNNISSPYSEFERKNKSTVAFFNWVYFFFNSHGIQNPFPNYYLIKTIIFQLEYRGFFLFLYDSLKAADSMSFVHWYHYPLFLIFAFYRLVYRLFE